MNTALHFSSEAIDWGTPRALFDALDARYSFDLDVCASAGNAKCSRYFTVETDGLAQDWGRSSCWENPPYSRKYLPLWVAKSIAAQKAGARVVLLVPSRTDARWFVRLVQPATTVLFLGKRVRYERGDCTDAAPFASAVIVLESFGRPDFEDRRVVFGGVEDL